jgi:hypothetical protein
MLHKNKECFDHVDFWGLKRTIAWISVCRKRQLVTASSSTLVKKISTNSFFPPTLRRAYHFSPKILLHLVLPAQLSFYTYSVLLSASLSLHLTPLLPIPATSCSLARSQSGINSERGSSGSPAGSRRGLHPATEWGNTEPGEYKCNRWSCACINHTVSATSESWRQSFHFAFQKTHLWLPAWGLTMPVREPPPELWMMSLVMCPTGWIIYEQIKLSCVLLFDIWK